VVFIADEIQTGFARTGAMFACELFDVVPDVIATAKGIAGGLPLSAVTGRAELMESVHVGGLGGTYGGNPVACAAALAAIETIKAENLVARAGEIERIMLGRLHRMQAEDNRIGDVRGRGAMIAVELVQRDTTDPDSGLAAAVATAAREQGVIVLTCGTYGNVLRFLPPLSISDELLNDGLDVLADAFSAS
jgi:4-aminobutyrate aminotransferase / (S)-3-amino-2-methylpropionate transaminase / 5-aminovalerate transaminase